MRPAHRLISALKKHYAMNKQQVLDHATHSLRAVFDQWDALCQCADYGLYPGYAGAWGGVRESTAETIARSMLAAVPLIINHRMVGATHLSTFYAAQILALAQDPQFAPRLDRCDQLTVEVAGICACLLTLEAHGHDILASLNLEQQQSVIGWVAKYESALFMNNNWLMFALVIKSWLRRRAGPHAAGIAPIQAGLWRLVDAFHIGNGFYRDGPAGPVDYYTHWSFQWYSLILVLARCTDDSIARTVQQRGRQFAHVLSGQIKAGPLPVAGRSQCYREAASAALALVGLVAQPMPGGHQLLEAHWRQWENSHGFDGVQREFYSCSASPMWRFKWYWQALLPDGDVWWATP